MKPVFLENKGEAGCNCSQVGDLCFEVYGGGSFDARSFVFCDSVRQEMEIGVFLFLDMRCSCI